jgi:hypothetical protein
MRRLIFLSAAAFLMAGNGCSAPAWWIADDSSSSEIDNAIPRLRANPLDDDGKEPPKSASNHQRLSSGEGSSTNAIATSAGDPLADEVRELGLEDANEEASALAALRAAPPQHRESLLRTMRASAVTRKQRESRAGSAFAREQAEPGDDRAAAGSPRQATQNTSSSPGSISQIASQGFELPANNVDRQTPPSDRVRQQNRPSRGRSGEVVLAANNNIEPDGPRVTAADHQETAAGRQGTEERTSFAGGAVAEDANWRMHVNAAIAALEGEMATNPSAVPAIEPRLRLLYLVAGRRDDAIRPRSGAAAGEQEFWTSEAFGLSVLLASDEQPDPKRRAAIAAPHFERAADRLGAIAGLTVKNLHFCTEVKGFGAFAAFPQDQFHSGQEVLLYCEIDNFQSELQDKGYHTALKGRYEIADESGRTVAEKELGLKDEHCANRRRDFFVPYFVTIPKHVPAGKYRLKVTLEDVHSGQTGEAAIAFEVKEK